MEIPYSYTKITDRVGFENQSLRCVSDTFSSDILNRGQGFILFQEFESKVELLYLKQIGWQKNVLLGVEVA